MLRIAEAIVRRRVADLVPYASNSRTHSAAQVAQVARSIAEFGFTNPVLVDGPGGIVAGHARVLAAKKLGLDEVPTIDLGYLTEPQRQAYVIADNKLAENAGWDLEMLRLELADLKADGFDLSLTGFGEMELGRLLGPGEGNTDPDETPAIAEFAVTERGDVWLLGRHRLVCGDSTVVGDVDKALNGATPHLMVTDPPYGVEYDPNWRNEVDRADGKPIGARAIGTVANDGQADWRDAWALFPGEVAYIWHAGRHASEVQSSIEAAGFEVRSQIIWAKHRHVLSRGHYHWQHEPCWYAVRKGKTGHWQGDRSQTTLWSIEDRASETGHGTQKPVECMRRPIENNSAQGDAVYEPFSGSGSTIIAAEQTGRACHAIELSPNYVDVAVRRWQAFTGEAAALEGDGRPFDDIAAQRRPEAA